MSRALFALPRRKCRLSQFTAIDNSTAWICIAESEEYERQSSGNPAGRVDELRFFIKRSIECHRRPFVSYTV